jgi:hypothetical protein
MVYKKPVFEVLAFHFYLLHNKGDKRMTEIITKKANTTNTTTTTTTNGKDKKMSNIEKIESRLGIDSSCRIEGLSRVDFCCLTLFYQESMEKARQKVLSNDLLNDDENKGVKYIIDVMADRQNAIGYAYESICKYPSSFASAGNVKEKRRIWLKIVRNCYRIEYKQSMQLGDNALKYLLKVHLGKGQHFDDLLEVEGYKETIAYIIDHLPKNLHEVFFLYFVKGEKEKTIAEKLNISQPAVNKKKKRITTLVLGKQKGKTTVSHFMSASGLFDERYHAVNGCGKGIFVEYQKLAPEPIGNEFTFPEIGNGVKDYLPERKRCKYPKLQGILITGNINSNTNRLSDNVSTAPVVPDTGYKDESRAIPHSFNFNALDRLKGIKNVELRTLLIQSFLHAAESQTAAVMRPEITTHAKADEDMANGFAYCEAKRRNGGVMRY